MISVVCNTDSVNVKIETKKKTTEKKLKYLKQADNTILSKYIKLLKFNLIAWVYF